jgi:hypothetical protein
MPRLMSTEATLARDVMNDVRAACERSGRPVEDPELRQALEDLDEDALARVQRVARGPLSAGPLGPHAIVDIARGVTPAVAEARELSGYYELRAERDALAIMARQPPPAAPSPVEAALAEAADRIANAVSGVAPPDLSTAETSPRPAGGEEAQALMTLFAYHRDSVRVAQELGISTSELAERIEQLGLKRRIHRLLESTTDIDVFSPGQFGTARMSPAPGPVVRKRSEKTLPPGEKTIPPGPGVAPWEKTLPPEGVSAEAAPTPPEMREAPAANTNPVNAHGTRVYRRVEPTPGPRELREGTPGPRREYVREVRRKVRPARAPPPKPSPVPPPPARRPFMDLQLPTGAAVLERLLAEEKANPRVLAAKLAERFDGPGRPLHESDLRALLHHHGLAQAFREREIANTRFLIGFHQGARAKLANALQMTPDELTSYLARLGLTDDLDRTRADRARQELGKRRINDRIVQVLTRAPYLDDLGVLQVIDREVREVLAEHLAAHPGEEGHEALRADLGLEKNAFAKLLRRYGFIDPASETTATP